MDKMEIKPATRTLLLHRHFFHKKKMTSTVTNENPAATQTRSACAPKGHEPPRRHHNPARNVYKTVLLYSGQRGDKPRRETLFELVVVVVMPLKKCTGMGID